MKIIPTPIPDLLILEPQVYRDDRGYFLETYNAAHFSLPAAFPFVQDNEAQSDKGILRGLHYQTGEYAQGKLVRVITGAVFDVAVDLRRHSPAYGQWFGTILSGDNKRQLWIPRGFAHGYLSLEAGTIFAYKCDNYYRKDAEGGVRYDDPALAVEWPVLDVPYVLSAKDLALPGLGQALPI